MYPQHIRTARKPAAWLGRLAAASLVLGIVVARPVAGQEICAQVVSLQGRVEIQRAGQAEWQPVERLDTRLCEGDRLRVGSLSRAALLVGPSALVRVDQNTVMGIRVRADETQVEFDSGAVYSISRFPRRFRINSPFVNANVEGTEFLVALGPNHAEVAVFEGRVATEDKIGTRTAQPVLQSGQLARFTRGAPAAVQALVNPTDAVQWALYYPAIDDGADRAAQLLRVGRVDDAERELRGMGARADALALASIIRVTKNDKAGALELAQQAVAADANSVRALLAQSYALQAAFRLDEALAAADRAVQIAPSSSIARARHAELLLSFGRINEAERTAGEAVKANPADSRARTVLGFAHLARLDTGGAREQLQAALTGDPADPLPRLGLGLADIKDGRLEEGRAQIEIAVSLDPQNSLLRSYLGKAYSDERRDELSGVQFARAKELDPRDPTPWFYNAVRLQFLNRPGDALQDLQASMARNENRAVYRSRLLLDQDQAARSASLAHIYSDLGFNELALSEGMRSINTDPRNFAAHRFLAETYERLPRYEVARVSEFLQSQMLQPAAAAVHSPRLGEVKSAIPQGSGPITPSFHEFNSLFARDGFIASAGAVVGGQGTVGDELLLAYRRSSRTVQFGQFYFETDGHREHADLRQRTYSVFYQDDITYSTSWQFEARTTEIDSGDIKLQFDPATFSPTERRKNDIDAFRLGLRHSTSPGSTWLASFIKTDRTDDLSQQLNFPPVRIDLANQVAVRGQQTELQYLGATRRVDVITGIGQARQHDENFSVTVLTFGPLPPFPPTRAASRSNARHGNAYLYGLWRGPWRSTITTAVAYDDFDDDVRFGQQRWSPKLGMVAPIGSGTTVRAAVFRSVKRPLAANQTLEPTQVAGFNQLFDDLNESRTKRVGAGVDQQFSPRLFAGLELTRRDLEVPSLAANNTLARFDRWDERLHRAYASWLMRPSLSLSAEYLYEDRYRDLPRTTGDVFPIESSTHQLPLGLKYHHGGGAFASIRASYVAQELRFRAAGSPVETTRESDFWVTDASIGTRLPRRLGTISLDVLNLFDEDFQYQDTDFFGTPRVPLFQPRRLIVLRARINL